MESPLKFLIYFCRVKKKTIDNFKYNLEWDKFYVHVSSKKKNTNFSRILWMKLKIIHDVDVMGEILDFFLIICLFQKLF